MTPGGVRNVCETSWGLLGAEMVIYHIPRPVRLGTPIARVHGGVMFEVAGCNVRALALSVAHSRPCASVVVLSCKKYGPGGT